ncbi:uncharacterized protein B0I36DRAFT_329821 [Microdochium trichocladiopsis]|uniref:GPI anchored protein n=1 Tax=Microdochium trichocladiopsis TaxID=1682393 RepID=A0A9P8XZM5_9PEZI|nr:uncharacterized protein B0I36DRAFT_329821 [Microdochium trichocladiopsis]KAH7026072.1 hypothetical protein B0I36DRAFT_329821 [Microdochium trichocladiopsis]
MHHPPLLPANLLQLLLLVSSTSPLLVRGSSDVLPTAVRKMSLDEGQKLMPEYVAFAVPRQYPLAEAAQLDAGYLGSRAATFPEDSYAAFQPPWSIHLLSRSSNSNSSPRDSRAAAAEKAQRDVLHRLQGRQFSCPDNTAACTNIGQPDYCCASGTTCFSVEGAPAAGNVGCCPNGQNCVGSVGDCAGGSTACAAEVGGGCCIPGYVCANVGCIGSWVSLITQTTVTSTVVNEPTPSTVVTTIVVTVTPSIEPTTRTVTSTKTNNPPEPSTTTQTQTDDDPSTSPTGSSSLGSAIAPVQPTAPANYCPTGFYACLAVGVGGGCCRTGRDCATTSCPPPPAMTTYTNNGVTVVVPVTDAEDAANALPTSTCAGGWFLCGKDAGPIAGCCPSGYQCGTASCTLVSGTPVATVNKELPSSGNSLRGSLSGAVAAMLTAGVLGAMLVY